MLSCKVKIHVPIKKYFQLTFLYMYFVTAYKFICKLRFL